MILVENPLPGKIICPDFREEFIPAREARAGSLLTPTKQKEVFRPPFSFSKVMK
jgi:hypothetical protein